MPVSKHNKSKKRKPGLTDNEKLIKKAHDDGVINDPPKKTDIYIPPQRSSQLVG